MQMKLYLMLLFRQVLLWKYVSIPKSGYIQKSESSAARSRDTVLHQWWTTTSSLQQLQSEEDLQRATSYWMDVPLGWWECSPSAAGALLLLPTSSLLPWCSPTHLPIKSPLAGRMESYFVFFEDGCNIKMSIKGKDEGSMMVFPQNIV